MVEINNRLPTKPNRWKITHESDNTQEYITWEYADEPVVEGTPINRGLYSRIYNEDIAKVGQIKLFSTIDNREGFLLCDGSLTSTVDYPDTTDIANCLIAIEQEGTFAYSYAGCDYSTSTEKLYFYKKTGTLVEVFVTTDLINFTKVTEYTVQYSNRVQAKYTNGAIIIICCSTSSGTGTFYYALTTDNTTFATYSVSAYNGSKPVFDYYDNKVVLGSQTSSSTKQCYRIDISNDGTTATSTALNFGFDGITYDKANNLWLVGARATSDPYYGLLRTSSDATTWATQNSTSQEQMFIKYNDYQHTVYRVQNGYVYEISDVTDFFNSEIQRYYNSELTSPTDVLEAKYPIVFKSASNNSIIMANFNTVQAFSNIRVNAMFAMGDSAYIVDTSSKLYKINITQPQGLILPTLQDSSNGYYGYMKVEVL